MNGLPNGSEANNNFHDEKRWKTQESNRLVRGQGQHDRQAAAAHPSAPHLR